MNRWLLALLVLLPLAASADTGPTNVRGLTGGAQSGTLCSAETTTGVCISTDEIVLDLRGRWSLSIYGNQSTATAYTCDVISNDIGHDAATGEGQDMTAGALTETNQMVALEGLMGYVWINCSTITGGNVTVTYLAVPLSR